MRPSLTRRVTWQRITLACSQTQSVDRHLPPSEKTQGYLCRSAIHRSVDAVPGSTNHAISALLACNTLDGAWMESSPRHPVSGEQRCSPAAGAEPPPHRPHPPPLPGQSSRTPSAARPGAQHPPMQDAASAASQSPPRYTPDSKPIVSCCSKQLMLSFALHSLLSLLGRKARRTMLARPCPFLEDQSLITCCISARCHVRSGLWGHHEKCRMTMNGSTPTWRWRKHCAPGGALPRGCHLSQRFAGSGAERQTPPLDFPRSPPPAHACLQKLPACSYQVHAMCP